MIESTTRQHGPVRWAVLAVFLVLAAGCGGSSDGASGPSSTRPGTTVAGPAQPTTTGPAPDRSGPAATISGPLTGGKGPSLVAAVAGPSLADNGYSDDEYEAAGTAVSYTAADLPTDGRWQLKEGPTADYATRIVVRVPTDAAKFNGTVVMEWLNVSAGFDSAPDYTYLGNELIRKGYGWVGVSAQRIGIEGGAVAVAAPGGDAAGAGKGIRALDPARYGKLHHPGDAFSYDLFTQVARALRTPGAVDPLHGLKVQTLLAAGESQSAFTLTTYADGVQPLTHMFDGFLIHSRGGAAAPLGTPGGGGIDIASSLSGKPTIIRTDLGVPTIIVETESDVLGIIGYYPARQDDSDEVRLWEVAGTAHADKYQIGDIEPTLGCAAPINRGQQSFVLKAALRHLATWARGGPPAPKADRLEVDTSGAKPAFVLDANGNVQGGVRTPSVDAPVDVLSGLPTPDATIICVLMGQTHPIPEARLHQLYADRAAYETAYAKAGDAAIAAGFILADDQPYLQAESQPGRFPI